MGNIGLLISITCVWVLYLSNALPPSLNKQLGMSGQEAFSKGKQLESDDDFEAASEYFWLSVLKGYQVDSSFQHYLKMYSLLDKLEEGYLNIAKQYYAQKNRESASKFVQMSIEAQPTFAAYCLLIDNAFDNPEKEKYLELADFVMNKESSEDNLHMGNEYFGLKKYSKSLEYFEAALKIDPNIDYAMASAAYIRSNMAEWGPNGKVFENDMLKVAKIIARENNTLEENIKKGTVQSSAVHPHMSLAYPIDPALKLIVARTHAYNEVQLVKKYNLTVYKHDYRKYKKETASKSFRLKVGYSSANFKSKATMYMAKDVLRNHDPKQIELHIFATSGPDNERFVREAMRGVDWRRELEQSAEYFHDVSSMDVLQQAKFIRSLGIHILIDWDGYSNNGVRAAGLFPQQPAPIQVLHQEYVGTMGAPYIQYIVTDPVASPLAYQQYYSEKFILMPNSFLANSFAYQVPHMSLPSYELDHDDTPQHNGCGSLPASFVFCSFNKHLKIEPSLFRLWLEILQQVEGSVMCLLEYPAESKANIWKFVDEFDTNLRKRVRFQPFLLNPYDNQRRVVSMCNAVLDTSVYNGHTTSYDALWGGIPVVTVDQGIDIAARVGVSILTVLNMTDLITHNRSEYTTVALRLATNAEYYQNTRRRIIDTCLQQSPKHPLWDMERYARNMEQGFHLVWNNFVSGNPPANVQVSDVGPSSSRRMQSTSATQKSGSNAKAKQTKRETGASAATENLEQFSVPTPSQHPELANSNSRAPAELEIIIAQMSPSLSENLEPAALSGATSQAIPKLNESNQSHVGDLIVHPKKKCTNCRCKSRKSSYARSNICRLPICSADNSRGSGNLPIEK